jgi:hypothetical protein
MFMGMSAMSRKSLVDTHACTGSFQAQVNQHPLQVTSLLAGLTLRPELSTTPCHWVWKVIAEGKVGRKCASIGLFFDRNLPLGTHDLLANPNIKIIYNQTPNGRNIIYHSGHFQSGQLTLLEADIPNRRLRGRFGFSISALDFAVTEGEFDLFCLPA